MAPPLATFEDSTLIKLALAGQTECFTILTNRHLPAVRRRIGSIVPNTTDADDLLQDVLLKVWRHLSTFRSESTFRTWMTRVAINEALQSYRRGQSRPICQALGDFDTFASSTESPLQTLTRAENDTGRSQSSGCTPCKVQAGRDPSPSRAAQFERDRSMPPIEHSGGEDTALPGPTHARSSTPAAKESWNR